MDKVILQIKETINGRDYVLLCDMDAPTVDAKEAIFKFQSYIYRAEEQAKQQQAKLLEAEKAKEIPPVQEAPPVVQEG